MTRSVVVFPDTNFFLECRVPEECAWADVVDADVVDLLVCRGVRRELDDQKRNARGRRQDRARRLSSQLRAADQSKQPVVLREGGPRVTIAAAPIVPRLPNYPPELQRDHPDDRIVCDLLDHVAAAPGIAPLFLTDDGHAAATALHVGLQVAHVSDAEDDTRRSWRLPPEPNPLQKRVSELERQVSGLTGAGPKIDVSFQNSDGLVTEALDVRCVRLAPLNPGEVTQLLERLEAMFPPEVEPEAPPRYPGNPALQQLENRLSRLNQMERFGLPAHSVKAYRAKRAEWLDGLREALCNIHESLMPTVNMFPVTIKIGNGGRQPVNSLLVTVEGVGDLTMCRVGNATDVPAQPLFNPPAPPRLNLFGGSLRPPIALSPELLGYHHHPATLVPDPHFFRWGRGSRKAFGTMDVECAEFLHGLVHPLELGAMPGGAAMVRGTAALRCTVRAANLAEPVVATLPCRFVPVDGDTMNLVTSLLDKAPGDALPG